MSHLGFIIDRCIAPESIPVLIDLGPLSGKSSRDHVAALLAAGLSHRNFSIERSGRLLVKLPKHKIETTLQSFPMIIAGATYFQTTHHWHGVAAGEQTAEVPTP